MGLSAGTLPSKLNRSTLPLSELSLWELTPPSPTSPVVMSKVLSGRTSRRLPLWMPPASTLCKICSSTNSVPFHVNLLSRSEVPPIQLPSV